MKSGIYQILNQITNKRYIGSTINFGKRKSEHFRKLKYNSHHSILLQNSYNKYGCDNFVFSIIELIDDNTKLLEREQYFLDLLKPEYNICISSSAPMMGRKHSKETIEKLKTRKVKRGKEHHLFGTKVKAETKEKQRLAKLGSKRNENTKAKIRAAAIRNNNVSTLEKVRHLQRKKIKDSIGNVFQSLIECAKFHEISPATVCDILKGRHHQTRKKVKFCYA